MSWNHDNVVGWLHEHGPKPPDLHGLIDGLGAEMLRLGAPVWRIRVAQRIVHPLTAAVSAIWERDEEPTGPIENAHGLEKRPEFKGSPLAEISVTRKPLRKDLTRLGPDDHLAYRELQARGATDYFGVPLPYGNHLSGILVVATDRPGGFDDADIDGIQILSMALAPLAEVHRLKTLSSAVTAAYLGERTGQRVLGGQITRGHIDAIEAAILFSDIRGWTDLNAKYPVEQTVELANRYFELIDQSVTAHGGEVLKLMGDGVLAIFPIGAEGENTCTRALVAARAALEKPTHDRLTFGIGLHFGRVMYGNVGSNRRLDFTVLGQAVNIASRIESLCARTGHALLFSREFADQLPDPQKSIGFFSLKGLEEKTEIFAPNQTL
ncbi:MAG: adenylate/guanylate cyclase domain-containing protein [Ruegeria sp.]